ncbi:unnamed protein product [marine sediment metagenome]|uniref:DUF2283 domain-containing protein n=1 Tax=marine sediment metagenome TaxID=412755 RepID=X1TPY0_9ZZZZ
MYIYLVGEPNGCPLVKAEKTVQIKGEEIYLDYDKGHSLIGIEILSIKDQPVVERIG